MEKLMTSICDIYSHSVTVQHDVRRGGECFTCDIYTDLCALKCRTNETLPIFLDSILGGGVLAVVSSTALILLFGEVIPQGKLTQCGTSSEC